jgi:DNA-3-methyladenine glycosylase
MQKLTKSFYDEQDVVAMAKNLLGKQISTQFEGEITSGIIVETEAYRGIDDKGCHAHRHGHTPRTATMFGAGGHAYMYICYGMHSMLNIVVGKEGVGDAVLVRAIEPTVNLERMLDRRSMSSVSRALTNGPGKTAKSLGLSKEHDKMCLYEENTPIWIEDIGREILSSNIYAGPRIGMSIFVEECSHWPWRFYIKDNPWVSKPASIAYEWFK